MTPLILPYKDKLPQIDKTAWIAPNAAVVGDVTIGAGANIWFGCQIRADDEPVTIGARTNIQDGTIIHITRGAQGTHIGSDVTVGHAAVIHACTVEDLSFIGMQACIMDGAVVESGALVAAGALVTPNKRVKTGQLWAGRPARYARDLTEEEAAYIKISANNYVELAEAHRASYPSGL